MCCKGGRSLIRRLHKRLRKQWHWRSNYTFCTAKRERKYPLSETFHLVSRQRRKKRLRYKPKRSGNIQHIRHEKQDLAHTVQGFHMKNIHGINQGVERNHHELFAQISVQIKSVYATASVLRHENWFRWHRLSAALTCLCSKNHSPGA